jgi:hypothetical protein
MESSKHRRRPEDDAGGGAAPIGAPSMLPVVSDEDLYLLREIARAGGGKHHVAPKTVAPSRMRELRLQGLVDTGDVYAHGKAHVGAKLTARGLQALAAAPGAISR